ncbi:MAG TPA: hypothetical protein VN648_07175, partial [Candidatus Methylomirabilis sp.]|nr:hypothetical protein [Candidatus Methylomirabilis sp.]
MREARRWLLVPAQTAHADAENGTTKFPTFLTGLPEIAASRPLFSSFPVFPQASIPAQSLDILNKEPRHCPALAGDAVAKRHKGLTTVRLPLATLSSLATRRSPLAAT